MRSARTGAPAGASALAGFGPPVRAWFEATFAAPTRAQELAWPAIASGEHTLLLAPTGSGKTLAAFLVALDRVMFAEPPPKRERCRVLYLSPLKALAVDVERNLRAPLEGIAAAASEAGVSFHTPSVSIRTGDTPAADRAKFERSPADLLITTPESLFLLLTSAARERLRTVRWVIVDEIHAMVNGKRGSHLAVSLERLEEICLAPFQRIGLSATQRPLEEVARFLGGFEEGGPPPESQRIDDLGDGLSALMPERAVASPAERPVRIVDAGSRKALDLRVEVAVENLFRGSASLSLQKPSDMTGGISPHTGGAWAAIHPMVLQLIREHRSTIVFVNSRRLAERMAAGINELAGEPVVQAHHGSISKEQRLQIEESLKRGKLPAIVATSSLELGIDMGAVDLVIQVESPPSVASGLQRIGRAGHQIEAQSKGVIVPKYRGDLLACAAMTASMREGAVEPMRYPRHPLDILAQQIVAMAGMEEWRVEDLLRVVRRAAPFAELPEAAFHGVLDMLSGRYPSDDFAELRPRITWDRAAGTLRAREGAKRIAIANAGTIPDRGAFGVYLTGSAHGKGRVGELDEELIFESRPGDRIILGASTWQIEEITHDRVLVSPAPGAPGRMPFWHGENAGRPLEFGRAIGRLARTLLEMPEPEAAALLQSEHHLSRDAARDLLDYLNGQAEATGAVPDDQTIVIERHKDELGDWRVCVLTPFGAKIHAPWALAIGQQLFDRSGAEADVMWSDNGIVIRLPDTDRPPDPEALLPSSALAENLVIRQLGAGGGGARAAHHGSPVNALFATKFREAAARALLLPKRKPGQRSPMWQLRKRAADLLRVSGRFGSFPIVLETYRECLRDVFDMPALKELLHDVETGAVRVVLADTLVPSPFASAILFSYVANFMYEGDAPLAERRAQALMVDPVQLRQLLGEAELRDLIEPDAIEETVRRLQHLTDELRCRHADALHDLLLRLGDLTRDEVRARCQSSDDADLWLCELQEAGRLVRLTIAGEERWVAAEDAARYRDAFGAALPGGLPPSLREATQDPLETLVARYARTHGPFLPREAANRFGAGTDPVDMALRSLESRGLAIRGELRPGGSGTDWCSADVLAAIRRRSAAKLRSEVEAVSPEAYSRFLLDRHGILDHDIAPASLRRAAPALASRPRLWSAEALGSPLLEAIRRLGEAPVAASALETSILPARVASFDWRDFDLLLATGQVVWVGDGPLGGMDGRIRLYVPEEDTIPAGQQVSSEKETDYLRARIRKHLLENGPSTFGRILAGIGGAFPGDALEALWAMVWDGEATSDTFQPVRERLNPLRDRKARELAGRGRHGGSRRPLLIGSTARLLGGSPPEASGRWRLLRRETTPSSSVEASLAAVSRLLDRLGVVTRESLALEDLPGGTAAGLAVLRAMEESGRVRRGYFVRGQGALQFAAQDALEHLRSRRDPGFRLRAMLLDASDPANPYGAALPWPPCEGRPTRTAGAKALLVDGALALWLSKSGSQAFPFATELADRDPREVGAAIASMLADEASRRSPRGLLIEQIGGAFASSSELAPALRAAGFESSHRGLLFRA